MSRHNRDGTGIDQRGYHYRISYPPDWLDRIRVTRRLASGRKSTRTLFRNPVRIPEVGAGGLQRAMELARTGDIVLCSGSLALAAESIEELEGIEPEIYENLRGPVHRPPARI